MTERALFAGFCLAIVALLAFLFVRSLKTDARAKPKVLRSDLIAVCGTVIVRYRPNPKRLDTFLFSGGEAGVGKKLREILAANPEADLAPLQDALGIVVQETQRRPRKPEIDGIVLGDE